MRSQSGVLGAFGMGIIALGRRFSVVKLNKLRDVVVVVVVVVGGDGDGVIDIDSGGGGDDGNRNASF